MKDHKETRQGGGEPKQLSLRQVLETIGHDNDHNDDAYGSSSDRDTLGPLHTKKRRLDQLFALEGDREDSVEIVVTARHNHNPSFRMMWNDSPPGPPISTLSTTQQEPQPQPQQSRLITILEQQEEDYEIISQKPSILWLDADDDTANTRRPSPSFHRKGIDWPGTFMDQETVIRDVMGLVCLMVMMMMTGATIIVYRYWIRPRRHPTRPVPKTNNGVENNHHGGLQVVNASSTVGTTVEASSLMDSTNKNLDATLFKSPLKNPKKRKPNDEIIEDKADDDPRRTHHDAKRLELATASNPPSLCNEQNHSHPSKDDPSIQLSIQQQSTAVHSEISASSVSDRHDTALSSPPLPHQRAMLDAASQLAWDIQVVQQVFEQWSLDVALAPQVALNLRCSQQLLAVQAAQHQELLLHQQRRISQDVSSYDFSWKDKLRRKRDECCHVAFRLLWEVTVVHWMVVRVARPIVQVFQSGRGDNGTILTSAQCLQFVLHTLCDCTSTRGSNIEKSSCTPTTSATGGTEGFGWISYVSTPNDALWHYYYSSGWWWNNASSGMFEIGACYGYCLVSTLVVLTMAFVTHQLFRAFSAPFVVHHAVNAVVMIILSGAGPTSLDNVTRLIPLPFLGILLVGVAGVLAVIQWNYHINHHKMMVGSQHDFRKSWEECLDTMNSLHFRISMTRYAALLFVVTGSGVFVWSANDDTSRVMEDTIGCAVAVTYQA
jgi:hypothetical protein